MNKLLLLADEREGAWPHEKTPKVYSSSERREEGGGGGRSHGVFLSPVLSRLVVLYGVCFVDAGDLWH